MDVRAVIGVAAAAVALGFGSGLAHAALPKPSCVNMSATLGMPAQGAVDVVFTNESSFICQLQGFPKIVLRGPAGSTYRAVESAGKAAVVKVQPGMTVHVHLTYASSAAACKKWLPSAVDVTLPVAGAAPFELTLHGIRVNNCTPGTVQAGAVALGDGSSAASTKQPPLSHDVCVPYRQALAIAAHAATFQGDVAAGKEQGLAWQEALQAISQQIGYKPAVAAALERLTHDAAVGVPSRGAAARDRDLGIVAAATGAGCARGLPHTAAQVAVAEGVVSSDGIPPECADVVGAVQSTLSSSYASASLVVDPYLFGVACNYQGGTQLLRRDPSFGWSVIASWTQRPCAVKGVPAAVLKDLFGTSCH